MRILFTLFILLIPILSIGQASFPFFSQKQAQSIVDDGVTLVLPKSPWSPSPLLVRMKMNELWSISKINRVITKDEFKRERKANPKENFVVLASRIKSGSTQTASGHTATNTCRSNVFRFYNKSLSTNKIVPFPTQKNFSMVDRVEYQIKICASLIMKGVEGRFTSGLHSMSELNKGGLKGRELLIWTGLVDGILNKEEIKEIYPGAFELADEEDWRISLREASKAEVVIPIHLKFCKNGARVDYYTVFMDPNSAEIIYVVRPTGLNLLADEKVRNSRFLTKRALKYLVKRLAYDDLRG